jgi:hypothetical protein
MPVSFAGWSVKAKVQNRRARVAEAAHKEIPAGGIRCPRPSAFGRSNTNGGTGIRTTRPREKRGAGTRACVRATQYANPAAEIGAKP